MLYATVTGAETFPDRVTVNFASLPSTVVVSAIDTRTVPSLSATVRSAELLSGSIDPAPVEASVKVTRSVSFGSSRSSVSVMIVKLPIVSPAGIVMVPSGAL